MNKLGSWEWRTIPPLTITRAIVALTLQAHRVLYVFLVNGRVELRDECNVADVDSWLFTVAPKSSPAEVLRLLMDGAALDAKEHPRAPRQVKHRDGSCAERILMLLATEGPQLADELATKLGETILNIRANLTQLRATNLICLTDIWVETHGKGTRPGKARKYDIARQAEAA